MNDTMDKSSTLVVFAKTPGTGDAKTRIAETEGRETADRIYDELLTITGNVASNFHYHVAYTGDNSPDTLRPYFDRAASFFAQSGETLGDRLRNAYLHLIEQGYRYIITIGVDCPTLVPEDIREAFVYLEQDIATAFGPATDGGYYLVGANPESLDIFSAKNWSASNLLTETLTIVYSRGYSCHILQPRADIDTMEDYVRWKEPVHAL
ncbi:MAG: DUF2064 domain-containing protein [Chitinivibrionales bacterium]|nr:DUF2064 domain-containing protein [Chitinivibrionales bacterium]